MTEETGARDVANDRECGELLRQSLLEFREKDGSSGLQRLVDDIESICRSLSGPSGRDRIRRHWWTLERVYASDVLRGGCATLPEESGKQVDAAVAELESAAGELCESGQARAA
ncbi:hypothetical protein [Streptomyces sp. HNM0574]|uniref:hypothetical protein n=1 Tax=Streptomyces sp. HNM0574 TaxID=2714954 RepID=UPI00146BF844|nr:hypothetical protein [Streptomyces sp. HNM0574]NLU70178.1 hypothetical protein [Streptomyces sp. HNM0574]